MCQLNSCMKKSMIKNYLVLKNYELTDAFFLDNTPESLVDARERYASMQNLTILSAQKFLVGFDAIIVDRATFPHDQYMFKHHMQTLHDRYHSEACNILYVDLDVIFTGPTDIFGKFHNFSMLQHNCGIRYYPAGGVPQHLWDIQRQGMEQWDETIGPHDVWYHTTEDGSGYQWDREQDIYAEMFQEYIHHDGDIGKSHKKFQGMIHSLYNEYPADRHPTMIHYNGTGHQNNPVETAERLWSYAKIGDTDSIRSMMNADRYRNWYHQPNDHDECDE